MRSFIVVLTGVTLHTRWFTLLGFLPESSGAVLRQLDLFPRLVQQVLHTAVLVRVEHQLLLLLVLGIHPDTLKLPLVLQLVNSYT